MNTVRWGIIGCGNVTEVKSGPALQKATNSELVAVMRRNGALARDFALRHGVPRWYDDAQDLINDPDVKCYLCGNASFFSQTVYAHGRQGEEAGLC